MKQKLINCISILFLAEIKEALKPIATLSTKVKPSFQKVIMVKVDSSMLRTCFIADVYETFDFNVLFIFQKISCS